jgi:glucose-6-phosphate isomerase
MSTKSSFRVSSGIFSASINGVELGKVLANKILPELENNEKLHHMTVLQRID